MHLPQLTTLIQNIIAAIDANEAGKLTHNELMAKLIEANKVLKIVMDHEIKE